uniref:Uncharacterized protein n=1 Tax=Anguilla anguilla TaxID=7936 RepID=A0A0E9XHG3_ANGAN
MWIFISRTEPKIFLVPKTSNTHFQRILNNFSNTFYSFSFTHLSSMSSSGRETVGNKNLAPVALVMGFLK